MYFGTFHVFSRRAWQSDIQVYEQQLAEISLAEELGYDSVWLTERHFTPYGTLPDPLVFAAAIARSTHRVRIGIAASVLPLHNPIRLAEQAVIVDLLSGGRLDLGVGLGFTRSRFRQFGVPVDEVSDRFAEGLLLLRQLLAGPRVSFEGRFFRARCVTIEPQPIQRPIPILVATTGGPARTDVAAVNQLPLLLGMGSDVDDHEIARRLELFGQASRQHGATVSAALATVESSWLLRPMFASDTSDRALSEPREALTWFYDWERPVGQEVGRPGEKPMPSSYERVLTAGIFGDPAACAERVAALEAAGVRRLLCWTNFGGMPPEDVHRSMSLFAREVMPHFRRATGAAPQ